MLDDARPSREEVERLIAVLEKRCSERHVDTGIGSHYGAAKAATDKRIVATLRSLLASTPAGFVAEMDEAIKALEPFAMCPMVGKHGGKFEIAHAIYSDMTKGGGAPRSAYWHADQFARAASTHAKLTERRAMIAAAPPPDAPHGR